MLAFLFRQLLLYDLTRIVQDPLFEPIVELCPHIWRDALSLLLHQLLIYLIQLRFFH